MKQAVRFFSLGILTSSFILLIIFLLSDSPDEKSALSTEELIAEIETKGYRVITEDDYITYTVNKHEAQEAEREANKRSNKKEKPHDEKKDEKATNKEKKKEEKKKEVKKYTVKIKSGMVPSEIAKKLEENGIIDDATAFANYLEENGYSPYVQIGSFKVNSDMSHKKLAETITKNRRP